MELKQLDVEWCILVVFWTMDQFINGEHAETIKPLIKNKRWLESFYKKQYVTILQKFYLEIVSK